MIRLSSIIARFEAELMAQYGSDLLSGQRRALDAMRRCRTALSPRIEAQCVACDQRRFLPHSCGHRLCPHCQHHESQQWLQRQINKQVPGQYFLLTFTLPAQLRGLAGRHQRTLYALMMQCSWETLRTFSRRDKQLQGTPGAIAVLHTHSRRLDYHPHVHLAMPAAAIDAHKRLWRTKTAKGKSVYLFNHKVSQAGLALPQRCPDTWVVDCKPVGSGEKALVYLGRYLYRGVIREKDILSCNDGQVTFRCSNSKTGRMEIRTLPGVAFLWLLLRHVLPKGFRRARNFGFLHPNSKRLIRLLHYLFKLNPDRASAWVRIRPAITCRCCGGAMQIVRTRIPPSQLGPYRPTDAAARTLVMWTLVM